MATPDWHMTGPNISTCNCDFGCPCQFNALPTNGDCRAAVGMLIEDGQYGDVSLNGLKWAALWAWPEAVHLGNGECMPIVDINANEAQRNALLQILSGAANEPGSSIFDVFATTLEKLHDPVFAEIDFTYDADNLTGQFSVDGMFQSAVEPILNPVTGDIHRASVNLPGGMEYKNAAYVSSTTKSTAAIAHDWAGSHGHMFTMSMGPSGPIA